MIVATAAIMACASHQVVTTASPGEVALVNNGGGMWIDSVGGTWLDTAGMFYIAGPTGTPLGFMPADVAMLSNANIVAHLASGDSLEIALSRVGLNQAENVEVHNFARRMVQEHTNHLKMAQQMAAQAGLTPLLPAADTVDATMAQRTIARLSTESPSTDYDRRFMRVEVAMHEHMLRELIMMHRQASGTTAQFITQTIPVVQQHLSDARRVWKEVGGNPATP
jgi:predicted outer membrane protein